MTYRTTTDREATLQFFSRGGGKGYQGTRIQGDIAGLMRRLGILSGWDSLPYGSRRAQPAEVRDAMYCAVHSFVMLQDQGPRWVVEVVGSRGV